VSREAQRTAVGLIRRGVAVIPVPAGEKNPGRTGWEDLRISEEEVPDFWTNGQNVGILTGEPSGGLSDVDLDSPEAVAVAGRFLPPTLTSGRESRPHSHWWYKCPGVRSRDWGFWNGEKFEKLLELRSTGRQTLVPPSVHPDGDRYLWHREAGLEASGTTPEELIEALNLLATAALVARRLPPTRDAGGGGRHDYALALAGFMLHPGRLDLGAVEKVLKAAWDAKGWPHDGVRREAHRDLEDIVRDTAARIAVGEPVVGGPTLEERAPGIVKALCKWWGWNTREPEASKAAPGDSENEAEERKPTQAEQLVGCAEGTDLFHTPEGDACARIRVDDHYETQPVRSKGYRRWLVRGFYERYGRPPGAQALQDALGLLEARAHFDGLEREVYVRVAQHADAIYVDLANERWESVEITARGWKVVSSEATPVRFRRPRGMLPLPVPERGGTLEELRRLVNVTDEDSWRLMVAWLVQALRPTGPYPVLLLQGEQGSAKSTAERLLRALVDPSAAPLRTTPRNEHDLFIAATSAWVVAFDNISNLHPWLSDALCRLSTGGGFSTRTLYENREQELFDATRPAIFNGITDVATRPDLLDRALIVTLPHIPEEDRKPEAELWAAFDKARPSILGALFDAVSGALGAVSSLRLERMPRMADFALWATAAEEALGWAPGSFLRAYTGNREEATETALDADPVGIAVRTFMEVRKEWSGTAGELWKALNELADDDIRHSRAWPGAPNALSGRLKRLAPALRRVGIEYEDARLPGGGRQRVKRLKKNTGEKDRPERPDRPARQESPANGRNEAGTILEQAGRSRDDDPQRTVPEESPANRRIRDDRDGRDDNSRPYSKERVGITAPGTGAVRSAHTKEKPAERCIHEFLGGKGCDMCDPNHPLRRKGGVG